MVDGWADFYIRLLLALALFPIGGYFWGAWMWRWCDKKYQEAILEGAIEKDASA